jgi:signal transduction histidine kinase
VWDTGGSSDQLSPLIEPCDHPSELVAVAQVGGHGLSVSIGGRHPLDMGLAGHAARRGEVIYITNDTSQDTRYVRPPGVHRDAGSEMCVPVLIEGQAIGVISVQSEDTNCFDQRDATALQTAATIAAMHIQSSRMFHEMRELKEFNETLVTTMLHSLMVVDRDGFIRIVNDRLCQSLRVSRDELINQHIGRVFNENVIKKHQLLGVLREVTSLGTARELPEVHIWTPEADYIFDLRISRVNFRGEAQAVILLLNVTQRWRQTQQLQLMNEMGRLFQASLDINKVLHTVLTCITAGPALGFNRAFLLLRNEDNDTLNGAMALGPSSRDEANRIWWELGSRQLSLQQILADETAFDPVHPTPLQERTLALNIDLQSPCFSVLAQAVRERRALLVQREGLITPGSYNTTRNGANGTTNCNVDMRAAVTDLFTAHETAIAPLAAKDRIVGLVIADNLYSATRIEESDIRLLETVAQQAGLTIDNALTYQALQKAQKDLVSAERLVVIGEMAARVSHEIRNPLATIGGFARSVLRRPDDPEVVRRKISVIVDEVTRLEDLLSDLLDMARPRQLDLQPNAINEIVEHALLLADADIKAVNIHVEKHLAVDLPLIQIDRRRVLQALLNTLRNGVQAMPDGGVLAVTTRLVHEPADTPIVEVEVRDNGVGISEFALKQVFDPFFSTKVSGSGLGLPVTLSIIRDHGGDIRVSSQEGGGTTFTIRLPVLQESHGQETSLAPSGASEQPTLQEQTR